MRAAQAEPERLWIGIEPLAESIARASADGRRRAGNALFAIGSVEALPAELEGVAGQVTVHLPWGSLLQAVALPDQARLGNIAAICRKGGRLQAVYSASARDVNEMARLGLANPDPLSRLAELQDGYAVAGFRLERIERVGSTDLRALGTTWAKRLAHDAERQAWRLSARLD